MAEASIPVDVLNPGQVFACLGFLEAADVLLGDAEGGFDWRDTPDTRFRLRAAGTEDPVKTVLNFLAEAEVHSVAPPESGLDTDSWRVPTRTLPIDAAFPFPLPSSAPTLPAVLEGVRAGVTRQVVMEHWGDVANKTSRDNVKFWAGMAGCPGARLARDALDLVRAHCVQAAEAPFNLSAEQSSSFRFDWRRDYIALDIGFSLNNHPSGRFATVGFPLVELLAAIGLTNARPEPLSKLEYRYGVLGIPDNNDLYDACFLRAALGGPKLPFPQRCFRMSLGWPGKENQARCITTVTEEHTQ